MKIRSLLLLGLLGLNSPALMADHTAPLQTKYPVMLVHGFGGFDAIGPYDYWAGIPAALQDDGAEVFVANLPAVNSPQYRGEQLIAQIENALAIHGSDKIHLIGHSLGGPTSRYAAGVRPELVASVTTVHSPNLGSVSSQKAYEMYEAGDTPGLDAMYKVINGFFGLLDLASGAPDPTNDAKALIYATHNKALQEFNTQFPYGMPTSYCGEGAELATNGVYYYSWGGNAVTTNALDPKELLHIASSRALFSREEENDGLLKTCNMHWGKYLGTYSLNHFDAINQMFGLTNLFEVDPISLYKKHLLRLKSKGL